MFRTKNITLLIFACLSFFSMSATGAETLSQADSLYRAGSYGEAVGMYEKALKQPEADAAIYYNLGNACFRTQQYAKAILCYERMLREYPGDADALFNLSLCQSKLSLKEQPRSDFFFITWWNSFRDMHSVSELMAYAFVFLVLCLLAFAGYMFLHSLLWRKVCFGFSVALLVVTLLLNVVAIQRAYIMSNTQWAIVMQDGTLLDNPVEKAKSVHKIHAGEKSVVLEVYQNNWLKIEMPDKHVGWVKKEQCSII